MQVSSAKPSIPIYFGAKLSEKWSGIGTLVTCPEDKVDFSSKQQKTLPVQVEGVFEKTQAKKALLKGDIEKYNALKAKLDEKGIILDLQGINLAGRNLQGVNFRNVDLTGKVDFSDTNLSYADFSGAYLCDANFYNASLFKTIFVGANLQNADFTRATLNLVDFSSRRTNLVNAKFIEATIRETNFRDADLYRAEFTDAYLYKVKLEGANRSGTLLDPDRPKRDLEFMLI